MLRLWPKLIDMIYPRTCAGCGKSVIDNDPQLCWECRSSLAIISHPFCSVCGEPLHGRVDHDFVCHVCVKRPPRYRRARAALHYNIIGKRLITQFKYNHALWLEGLLVDLLVACVDAHYSVDAFDGICAVPLHPVKLRMRGYNQSLLLARQLSKRIGKPMLGVGNLRRSKATSTQTRLTAGQRITNVSNAFDISRPGEFAGKRILLVDDVLTTGATVSACALEMRNAGADSVDVVTVARGI